MVLLPTALRYTPASPLPSLFFNLVVFCLRSFLGSVQSLESGSNVLQARVSFSLRVCTCRVLGFSLPPWFKVPLPGFPTPGFSNSPGRRRLSFTGPMVYLPGVFPPTPSRDVMPHIRVFSPFPYRDYLTSFIVPGGQPGKGAFPQDSSTAAKYYCLFLFFRRTVTPRHAEYQIRRRHEEVSCFGFGRRRPPTLLRVSVPRSFPLLSRS